uniref:Uncharacterized protein n=1 Tax=Parascaris univalens TaxID=6257 RepID=A0A915C8R2_PARUN
MKRWFFPSIVEKASNAANRTRSLLFVDTVDRSLSQQLSALQTHDAVSSHDNKKVEATYADNSTRLDQTEAGLAKAAFNKTAPISEREAAEMAQWLEAQESKTTTAPGEAANPSGNEGSVKNKTDPNAAL